jgi:hypothetical protein
MLNATTLSLFELAPSPFILDGIQRVPSLISSIQVLDRSNHLNTMLDSFLGITFSE